MANVKGNRAGKLRRDKKKYWRHGTKVADIEDFLEDQRETDRLTGNAGSEKRKRLTERADAELFVLEKSGKSNNEENRAVAKPRSELDSRKLRCFQSLEPCPLATSFRPRYTTAGKPEKVPKVKKVRPVLTIEEEQLYDLWGDVVPKKAEPVKLSHQKRGPEPSVVPAVELPHPGSSYNPALDDHVELLTIANNTEVVKQRAIERLNRLANPPPKHTLATPESMLRELTEGLGLTKEEKVEDDEIIDQEQEINADDVTYIPAKKIFRSEDRKTKKQRRLEGREKFRQARKKLNKARQERAKALKKLPEIVTEIQTKEKINAEKLTRTVKKREELRVTVPVKLSNVPYEEPDLDLQLSNEIGGSLRLLKPEGCLLRDRYKSLQKRNIVEPRKRQKRFRKYPLKKYTLRSHRDIPAGYRPI